MICPNCGTNNEDNYQFCMSCGKPLAIIGVVQPAIQERAAADSVASPPKPAFKPTGDYARQKDLLKESITPADCELSVRTYYCTYYRSRLLGMEASGYIGITNKRVIFQAIGRSNASSSVLQSEVPIADVSGISSYKGMYFSIGHLITALAAAFLAFAFITPVATLLGTVLGLSSQSFGAISVVGWLLGIATFLVSFGPSRESIWKTVLATISIVGFSMAAGGSIFGGFSRSLSSLGQSQSGGGAGALAFLLAFVAVIYTMVCIFWYARRPTFSIAINSKGGASTPINITGASVLGLFDVSAGKALSAEPTEYSEVMLKEIGAVILDIQMLGDLGMNKWKEF